MTKLLTFQMPKTAIRDVLGEAGLVCKSAVKTLHTFMLFLVMVLLFEELISKEPVISHTVICLEERQTATT